MSTSVTETEVNDAETPDLDYDPSVADVNMLEDKLPDLKSYMEYQRKLFPYTVVRAGLDLAYKEVDDILNFVDNDYRPRDVAAG